MNDPPWREQRPNRPYGGEPGARPRGRVPGPPPGTPGAPTGGTPGERGGAVPPGAGRTPQREPGRGGADPRESDPRGPNPGPGWGGRDPGGQAPGGQAPGGRGQAGSGGRGGNGRDPGDGPPTRRMPAQPLTTPPGATQPGGVRGDAIQPGSRRDDRGRRNRRRAPGRWGSLQGGLGVCIIVASAAAGTIATMLTRSSPGFLLGLCVVAGTVVAALVVRPQAGRMILPAPVLSYLVGALVSGFVYNRSVGTSRTALAIGAAQWIADGFFAMVLATVAAIAITTARWLLWRRRRPVPAPRDKDWTPADGSRPGPPRRPRETWDPAAEPGYPGRPGAPRSPRTTAGPRTQSDQGGWNEADPRGAPRRPPGPWSGTGPYNFSSGA